MKKLIEFWQVYRMYAKHHSHRYAIRQAWWVAGRNLPF